MSNILCPYCASKITPLNVKYECLSCGEEIKISAFESMMKMTPKCKNEKCKKDRNVVIKCRKCDSHLPPDIFQYKGYLPYSIVGISGAGKTNFITVLLEELRRSGIMSVSHMTRETIERFRTERDRIYYEHIPCDATPRGDILPYQWRIQKKVSNSKIDSYCMTIFDGAGEDYECVDEKILSYIAASKYIVFLVDPTALLHVRRSISNKDLLDWSSASHLHNDYQKNDASQELVQDMAAYIRKARHIKVGRSIDTPVAICFTKIDLLLDQFGQQTITRPSPHIKNHGYKSEDGSLVDQEIRDYLQRIGEQCFLNAVDTNFKNVQFFGVSSFGNSPIGQKSLGSIEPHRVLDPLMWILSKEGIVPKL